MWGGLLIYGRAAVAESLWPLQEAVQYRHQDMGQEFYLLWRAQDARVSKPDLESKLFFLPGAI